jgi:hypothetical protein
MNPDNGIRFTSTPTSPKSGLVQQAKRGQWDGAAAEGDLLRVDLVAMPTVVGLPTSAKSAYSGHQR